MRHLRILLLGLLAFLALLPTALAADHDAILSLRPVADPPPAAVGLQHPLPDHPGPGDQGQLASSQPACDKDVDLTSTFAGVTPITAQDNLICTSSDIDTYVGQDGETYVVQAGGQEAAFTITHVASDGTPTLITQNIWVGPGGDPLLVYTPDVKAFKQGTMRYIALSLERLSAPPPQTTCGVVIVDVTDLLNLNVVEQFIGADWCDVHNSFVEDDASGDGAFIYATADNTQDLRVLDISDISNITELGKYRRSVRGFGATVFDDIYVHDVTVVGGKVYASYWRAGLDIFDASLIKVAGATVAETNPGVVNITPPLFNGTPFLVHHAFPSGDGSHVFIEDEITFQAGFQPVQMWTTASTPSYVDGVELAGSGAADVPFVLPAHNLLVNGERLYVGWYKAGLQAFDFDSTGFVGRPIYHQVQTEAGDSPSDGAWAVRLAAIGTTTYVFQSDRRYGLIVDATLDSLDTDGDTVLDSSDNCPFVPNGPSEAGIPGVGNQANTDEALGAAGATIDGVPIGDADGDACDLDDDDDGSTDSLEGYLGTNPLDNCGLNAWPPDTDTVSSVVGAGNGTVNNLDSIIVLAHWLESDPDPGYIQRADIFDGNGTINNLDMIPVLSNWLYECT